MKKKKKYNRTTQRVATMLDLLSKIKTKDLQIQRGKKTVKETVYDACYSMISKSKTSKGKMRRLMLRASV